MEINALLVKQKRTENNWTQQHLADACSLSLRTIQRVERYGNASNETVSALCAVLEVDSSELITPEVDNIAIEKESKPAWVERSSLIFISLTLGYILAVLTI